MEEEKNSNRYKTEAHKNDFVYANARKGAKRPATRSKNAITQPKTKIVKKQFNQTDLDMDKRKRARQRQDAPVDSFESKVSYALTVLQESTIPEKLLCRDEEKKMMKNFLNEGIDTKGNSQSLYIAGVPGLGKTACLMEVVQEMKTERSDFIFHYINGLKLKKPDDFYGDLFNFLTEKPKYNAKECCKYLDYFF
jgi:predicted ATPase